MDGGWGRPSERGEKAKNKNPTSLTLVSFFSPPPAPFPPPPSHSTTRMVERVTYRRRHSYATKSNKVRKVKTPGACCRVCGVRRSRLWSPHRSELPPSGAGGVCGDRDAGEGERAGTRAGRKRAHAKKRAGVGPSGSPCRRRVTSFWRPAAGPPDAVQRRVCARACAQAQRRAFGGSRERAFFFFFGPIGDGRRSRLPDAAALPAGLPARRSTSRIIEPAPPRTPGGRPGSAAATCEPPSADPSQFPLSPSSPGGRLVVQYLRKKPSAPKCGATGVALHGVSVLSGGREEREGSAA